MSHFKTIRPTARPALAVLATIATTTSLLVMSGCGASDGVEPVARAAGITQSQPGAQILVTGEIVSPLGARPLDFSGRGIVSNAPLAAQMHLDFSHLTFGKSDNRLSAEVRILRHVFFFRIPALAGQLHGRRWLRIDEGRTTKTEGLGSLPSADELDPDQYLTYLLAVSGGLTGIGKQMVHGVSTTGYRGEIELDKVAEQAPSDRRAASVAAVGNLERITGVSTVPFQVWIDNEGRVRRVSLSEGESSTIPNAVKVYVTVDFVRFGHERLPPSPPAAEVFDATAAGSSRVGGR